MFTSAALAAAIRPAAKTRESPVIKGMNAPISKPVPAKTRPQTTR
jgi:hypothetical protein